MNPGVELPLRDIHLPTPVSWWPPAPGWWLVAVLLALGCGGLAWGWRQWRRGAVRRRSRQVLRALFREYHQRGEAGRLLQGLSLLLRRIALSHYPREQVAGLVGMAWLEFLDRPLANTRHARGFSAGAGQALAAGPYATVLPGGLDGLEDLCLIWVRHLPRSVRR
jgi:hypothetical protein